MQADYFKNKCNNFDENYKIVTEKLNNAAIKSGRKFDDLTLLAATKTVEAPVINYSHKKGIKVIGENRVQEFLSKYEEFDKSIRRHFIGTLQTNKVKQIVGNVELIQSVDSIKLAKEISKQSKALSIVSDVLVEINIGNEESKGGINECKLSDFLDEISEFDGVCVRGLMTIGPVNAKVSKKVEYFDKMQKLFIDNRAKKVDNIFMDFLSMGMSDDFELAVLSGSNMVRIGSALYGERIYNN